MILKRKERMIKCGKGCLPECEYFTTGECISPFNCPYQEEVLTYILVISGSSFTYSIDGSLSEE